MENIGQSLLIDYNILNQGLEILLFLEKGWRVNMLSFMVQDKKLRVL
jgi:hypothetical protein